MEPPDQTSREKHMYIKATFYHISCSKCFGSLRQLSGRQSILSSVIPFLAREVNMSKYPLARYWTPNCPRWLRECIWMVLALDEQAAPYMLASATSVNADLLEIDR